MLTDLPRGRCAPRREQECPIGRYAKRAWVGRPGSGRAGAFAWFLLSAVLLAGPAQAFTVNSTADTDDPTPDGVCDSDPGVPVVCTLREAIREANFVAGADLIDFNIPPAGAKTIILLSILPGITSVVTIDGTTQPGFLGAPFFAPVIELNAAAGGVTGLLLDVGSSGSTIRGLCINRTQGAAIRITGSSNNVVAGNFLGTNALGSGPGPGNDVGVFVGFSGVTNNNRIGGIVDADRNIISGNDIDGVQILNGGGTAANNLVQGNFIGLDVTGALDVGNGSQGVSIFGGTDNNTVGGNVPGARNVISGNDNTGVRITGAGTTGNRVQSNSIGTNAAGTAAIGNLRGIEVIGGSSGSIIGGALGTGNLISGNLTLGILISGSNNNTADRNLIGTDISGTLDLGNLQHGVQLGGGASNNVIGGVSGIGNVISGNNANGVDVVGIGTSNNRVVGNIVGLDINGVADLGNTLVGVAVGQGATANIIGEPGGGNVISGNDQFGVRIVDPGTNSNLVQSNHIGVDVTGSLARGNGSDGVRLEASGAATGNVIGGTAAGVRNVISGNGGSGIQVRDFVTGTLIAGNMTRPRLRGHRRPRQRAAWRPHRRGVRGQHHRRAERERAQRPLRQRRPGRADRWPEHEQQPGGGQPHRDERRGHRGHRQRRGRDRHHQPGREQHHRGVERREPDRLQHHVWSERGRGGGDRQLHPGQRHLQQHRARDRPLERRRHRERPERRRHRPQRPPELPLDHVSLRLRRHPDRELQARPSRGLLPDRDVQEPVRCGSQRIRGGGGLRERGQRHQPSGRGPLLQPDLRGRRQRRDHGHHHGLHRRGGLRGVRQHVGVQQGHAGGHHRRGARILHGPRTGRGGGPLLDDRFGVEQPRVPSVPIGLALPALTSGSRPP